MQGINMLSHLHKVIFMATQKPAIKARPIAGLVAKRLPLTNTPTRDDAQGMTASGVPFGEISQERFLTEILLYVILVPLMAAALDKCLPGESAWH
jgi:hypothetical protein